MLNWKEENGQWFCYKDGEKLMSQWVQDDNEKFYYLEKDGHLVTGWFQTATDGDLWFYSYPEKTEKDGNTHYTGEMATGWIEIDSKWYYLYPEKIEKDGNTHYVGEMAIGWIELDSKWYYLNPNEYDSNTCIAKGQMIADRTMSIDNKSYNFDEDGVMQETTSCYGLSDDGAEFISSWEGYSSTWEDVGDGYQTIGIGTATSGTLGKQLYDSGITSCTKEQAYKWLEQECSSCYESIKSKLDSNSITLAQNQIDALISMAYNIGSSGLLGSTLFKNILNDVTDEATIRSNFEAWDKCNGVVWEGLKKRRDSECNLYLNADYTGNV